jgi:uncharacterized phage protein gp47/JayE
MSYNSIKEVSVASAKKQILQWFTDLDLPVLHWGPGSFPTMVLEVGARIWNTVSKEAAELKTFSVGEAVRGDALDLYSKSVYNHTRNPSIAAIHQVRFTCAVGSGPYTITEGSAVVTDGTYQFSTSNCDSLPIAYPVTLASGGTVLLPCIADKPGSASSAIAPGTITRLVTTMAGVTVTNPGVSSTAPSSLLVAGANKESDAQLHERNRTIWATRNVLSIPIDGYRYWARTVPGVRRVGVIANNPRGAFTLDVVLAGDAGVVTGTEVDAVKLVLQSKLLANFYAAISVYSATPRNFTPVGKIYLKPGTDIDEAQTAIRAALEGNEDDTDPVNETCLERNLPVGGTTYDGTEHQMLRAQFEEAIRKALIGDALCVDLVELSSPDVSTTIAANEVPTITVTFDNDHLRLVVLTS